MYLNLDQFFSSQISFHGEVGKKLLRHCSLVNHAQVFHYCAIAHWLITHRFFTPTEFGGGYAELSKQNRSKIHYGPSPGLCCVGACTRSRPTLELEQDKTGIPAIVGGISGEGYGPSRPHQDDWQVCSSWPITSECFGLCFSFH